MLPGSEPLPWWQVARAGWERPRLAVTVVAPVDGTGHSVEVELAEDDGGLPDLIRTRVTASVAWSSKTRLSSAGTVRVVGRRRPDREALEWQLVYDREADRHDPASVAEAEQLLDNARRTIG